MPNANDRKIIERFVNDSAWEMNDHELEELLDNELSKPADQMDMQLIRELLVVMESEARKNGVTVVIEPLNKKETNVLLTTEEAMEYIRELELPNLKLLVDLYHFYCEGEPLDRIREYGPFIKHVHIVEPTRRDYMRPEDEYDYTAFVMALRDVWYDGALMFEGGLGDYDTGIRATYPVLRGLV